MDIPENLAQLANRVFGPDAGPRWWTEPAFGLSWQRPVQVLALPSGAEAIEDLVRLIEWNVYT
jgi:uncharacterized protein (DUF2384 family)